MAIRVLHLAKSISILRPLADGAVPDRLLVFPDGINQAVWEDGHECTCFMDATAAGMVIAAHAALGRDSVIDYEHQTDAPWKHPEGRAPAAGWISNYEYVNGEGLYAACKWTAQGADYLKTMQYRYFSPVFYTDDNMRVCEVPRLALTNSPAFIESKPIAASSRTSNGDATMKNVCKLLGIAETSDEAAICSAIEAIKKSAPTEDAVAATLATACGIEAKDKTAFIASVTGMKKPVDIDPTKWVARSDFDAAKSRVDALEKGQRDSEREKFMAAGTVAGKITSGNRELWLAAYEHDATKAVTMLASAAVLVPPGQITRSDNAPNNTTREGIIARAQAAYAPGPAKMKQLASCQAFVNVALGEAGFPGLTNDESAKISG